MQEQVERATSVFAELARASEAFAQATTEAVAANDGLPAALWDGFMELPESERDKRNPNWREDYAEWREYLRSAKSPLRIIE